MSKLILSEISYPMNNTMWCLLHAVKSSFNEIYLDERGFSSEDISNIWSGIKHLESHIGALSEVESGSERTLFFGLVSGTVTALLSKMDRTLYTCSGDRKITVPMFFCMDLSLRFQTSLFEAMYGDGGFVDPADFCRELIAVWRLLPVIPFMVNEFQPEVEMPLVGTNGQEQ